MLYVIILCIMLCCGCLFVELIDRREGVLAERRERTVKEGKERWIEAGSLEGAVTCFLVDLTYLETISALEFFVCCVLLFCSTSLV